MINRRQFLHTSSLGLASLAALQSRHLWANSAPLAQVKPNQTLIVLFLRGGLDGLNLVVPYGDEHYYQHRRGIAIPRPGQPKGALDLDGFFGLHPAAQALFPLFKNKQACALQAVGYAKNTRSHFEEQDTWETAQTGNTLTADGWLNRHLQSTQGNGIIRAVSIGGQLPRLLRGKAPAYAIRGVNDLTFPSLPGDPAQVEAALKVAYCETSPKHHESLDLLSQTAAATLEGAKQLKSIAAQQYKAQHGAQYGKSRISQQFKEAARLIRAKIGTEVIQMDYGSWDTHSGQGGSDGNFANQVRDLSEAIHQFHQDLGDEMKNIVILTLSDFGRTVRENGTGGTDHGWANCLLAIGGSQSGSWDKMVRGEWPGLAPEQLHQNRDLRHTTDFRDVIGEVVSKHLGNPQLAQVLPGHEVKQSPLNL